MTATPEVDRALQSSVSHSNVPNFVPDGVKTGLTVVLVLAGISAAGLLIWAATTL